MKKKEAIISLAFLTVLLAALIAAAVAVARFGLTSINRALDSLNPQTGIVLGVSSIVALVSAALIGRAIRLAKQCELDSREHSERAMLYQALMEWVLVLVSDGATHGRNGTGDLSAVERAFFLRGSAAANKEYRALLRLLSDPGADEKVFRSQITKFLMALRRDCGRSSYGLENEDWSDLVRFASRQVVSAQNAGAPPPHFAGANAAPPTHRLSPRG